MQEVDISLQAVRNSYNRLRRLSEMAAKYPKGSAAHTFIFEKFWETQELSNKQKALRDSKSIHYQPHQPKESRWLN